MKKFSFRKFAGLHAYSRQLYYQMNSFKGIFRQLLSPPMLPPCIDLSPKFWRWGWGRVWHSPPCSQHLWETLVVELAFSTDFLYMFSIKMFLTKSISVDQVPVSDLTSFLRYQTKCVFKFFFSQLMTRWTLKFSFIIFSSIRWQMQKEGRE